jgi:SAM-dependent methyltransferase
MTTPHQTRDLLSAGARLSGQDEFFEKVNRKVAVDDGMYRCNDRQYFEVGADALRLIRQALAVAALSTGQIQRVLDYGCGFGRVLRWLQAAFPLAQIIAADINRAAVGAVQSIFGVDAFVLDASLKEEIGREFDLIWVGSLATHLPENQVRAVFVRLASLLSAHGLIVASVCGPYVLDRLSRREKTYGLDDAGIARLITGYQNTGYGFSSYPNQSSYGISVCRTSKLVLLIEHAGLQTVFFEGRGWVRHQDCVAMVKMPPTYSVPQPPRSVVVAN